MQQIQKIQLWMLLQKNRALGPARFLQVLFLQDFLMKPERLGEYTITKKDTALREVIKKWCAEAGFQLKKALTRNNFLDKFN